MKPWKTHLAPGGADGLGRFNLATAMKPWKTPAPDSAHAAFHRFNLATAMKPWKTCQALTESSGGPLGFNLATAMKPWKTARPLAIMMSAASLQFGHGDEAVEDLALQAFGRAVVPRLQFGHGDEAVEDYRALDPAPDPLGRFNLATAMKPWKTSRAETPTIR